MICNCQNIFWNILFSWSSSNFPSITKAETSMLINVAFTLKVSNYPQHKEFSNVIQFFWWKLSEILNSKVTKVSGLQWQLCSISRKSNGLISQQRILKNLQKLSFSFEKIKKRTTKNNFKMREMTLNQKLWAVLDFWWISPFEKMAISLAKITVQLRSLGYWRITKNQILNLENFTISKFQKWPLDTSNSP